MSLKELYLSPERVRYLLDYDLATGVFCWKNPNRGKAKKGQTVKGWSVGKGYLAVGIDERRYTLHRLAWCHFYGRWPSGDIDHANRIKTDNRIENLRECDASLNGANMKGRSRTGFKGVYFEKRSGRFYALICCRGKQRNLGTYDTPEEAHAAYCEAAVKLFGEFARTG